MGSNLGQMRVVSAACAMALAIATPAHVFGGQLNQCRMLDVQFVPAPGLQIAVWLETADGAFVDTLFLTQAVATYGLGNRPGTQEFNSQFRWPYGRRENTFPVWAHRQPHEFARVVFQDGDDDDLSHKFAESSVEPYFCAPMLPAAEPVDGTSCASVVYTDKGLFSPTQISKYPPRDDITKQAGIDTADVATFDDVNPFDAVSYATPAGGEPYALSWSLPPGLATGAYVVWLEVSKEGDFNAAYPGTRFSPPPGWGDYGEAYRGQPSVIYAVPVEIAEDGRVASSLAYVGYGAPEGEDGMVRLPDTTIDTKIVGSGAARLSLTSDDGQTFRVRVQTRIEQDELPPGAIAGLVPGDVTDTSADITFVAPADDDGAAITGYEVRFGTEPITEENFLTATLAGPTVTPGAPGNAQHLRLDGLLPQTTYYVAVRSFDRCRNHSAVVAQQFTTAERVPGSVDACFIATAAYGSLMAADVVSMRRVRDNVLRTTVIGELVTSAYYTFGPAAANVIGPAPVLRALARELLAPVARAVRWLRRIGG